MVTSTSRRRMALVIIVSLTTAGLLSGCGTGSAGPGVAQIGTGTHSTTQGAGSTAGTPGAKGVADMLAFSRCMRSHGLPNFPDPVIHGQSGELTISSRSGLDPNSSRFQSAQNACRSFLPQRGTGGTISPKQRQQLLAFSRCIRSHGVPNFPDPTFSGDTARIAGSGIDPHSAQLQSAQNACRSILPFQ